MAGLDEQIEAGYNWVSCIGSWPLVLSFFFCGTVLQEMKLFVFLRLFDIGRLHSSVQFWWICVFGTGDLPTYTIL